MRFCFHFYLQFLLKYIVTSKQNNFLHNGLENKPILNNPLFKYEPLRDGLLNNSYCNTEQARKSRAELII